MKHASDDKIINGLLLIGDLIRDIASECGFEVDEEQASVIDHLNYDFADSGKVSASDVILENCVG